MKSRARKFAECLAVSLMLAGAARAEDVLPTLTLDDDDVQQSAKTAKAPAAAQTNDAVAAAPVEASEDALDIEAARERGIKYLRALAEKDPAGFVAPPKRHSQIVEWEEKPLRYSEKLIDVPVYETVEEFRNVKVGDSVNAATIRKKVQVKKRVGTRKEKREVLDRNGDIEKMTKVPKYDTGGPEEWRSFLFGHNAMALYAMIRAGVDPTDGVILNPAGELLKYYEQYGLPDLTWDLAWSIAAFSEIDQPPFQDMAAKMAGKLMDGQIAEGNAAGLWGPLCINTSLLSAMLQKQAEYSQFYFAAKAKNDQKSSPGLESKMQAALDALRMFGQLLKRVSVLGPLAFDGGIYANLKDDDGIANPILVPRYPNYIVNQTSADMESTAVALFGIRVAIEKKLLPKETWRPNDDKGKPIVPVKTSGEVLGNAFSAIVKAQRREGWDELNMHQPVDDFDAMKGLAGVPADKAAFKPLASPLTETSTAQGYSVFTCYGKAYGMPGLGTIARNVVAGNAAVKGALDAGFKTVKGGQAAPYDFCFFLSEVPDLGKPEYDLCSRERIAEFLIDKQNKDGSWGGKPGSKQLLPSSLRERISALPARYVPGKGIDACNLSAPHVPAGLEAEKANSTLSRLYGFQPTVLATSYALLSLAEPPAAGK